MKDALREECYFRALIENSSEAIVVLDGDGNVRYESPSYERLLGYKPGERADNTMFERLHPEDARKVAAAFAGFLEKNDGTLRMEVRARHKDGSWRTFEAVGRNLLDDPAVAGVVVNMRDITERKDAEEALRREEKRFRALIDSSLDAITLIHADGTLGYESPSVESVMGYAPGERAGRDGFDFVHPDDVPAAAQAFADIIADPALIARMELRAQHKNGSWRYLEVTGRNLLDDPAVAGVLVSMRDITERKEAEKALRESKLQYSLLVDNIADAVFRYRDGALVWGNDRIREMMGYEKDEVIGADLSLLVPEDEDLVEVMKRVMPDLQTKGHSKGTSRATRKDGRVIDIEYTVARVPGSDPIELVGIARDVTERKRAEKELRRSEAKFRQIFNSVNDEIVLADTAGVIIDVNDKSEVIMGYSPEESRGRTGMEMGVFDTDQSVRIAEMIEAAAADQSNVRPLLELWARHKDGHLVPVEVSSSAMTSAEGELEGFVAVIRDISERKRAEEERGRLIEEVADKNKELEHIVYVSSHDLRSPLVNIQGFSKELNYSLQELVSILQHEEISQEVRDKLAPIVETDIADSLTYIQASILKMDSLLSGLLRLSRLGRAALNFETLDIAGMVSEIIKGNEYRIKSAKVTVEAGDLPPCTGDSVQINQVFSNLVDNALKYLDPARPGTIRITGRAEGDRSVYCVEDNGVGIADEDREKVFDIFQQLNPGTSTGEGLGLAVVRKILSRNDGRIWVESEPGVGSKFFVSLPSARENESGGKQS